MKKRTDYLGVLLILLSIFFIFVLYSVYAKAIVLYWYGFNEEFKESDISAEKKVAEELNQYFLNSEGKEYAGCLSVKRVTTFYNRENNINDTFIVEAATGIEYYGYDYSKIGGTCGGGSIHSHPKGTCGFSRGDIVSFKERIRDHGDIVMVIQCGEDKFISIDRNDFEAKLMRIA